MNTILTIIIVILAVMVIVSLVRGIIAFMQSTKIDLQTGEGQNATDMQMKQNQAMFARIKYQGLAVVVIAVLLILNS